MKTVIFGDVTKIDDNLTVILWKLKLSYELTVILRRLKLMTI